VADEAGLIFHAELQWDILRPHVEAAAQGVPGQFYAFLAERPGETSPATSAERGRWPLEGTLGEPARSRLFGLLADTARGQQVYFYYGVAASFLCLKDLLYLAPADALEAVQLLANEEVTPNPFPLPGPEYVWPVDRSWVVATDYDLVSTYVACDARLAERLLADDTLEMLPVSLETRIDHDADSMNGKGRDGPTISSAKPPRRAGGGTER
jgi:hypothetical protein